MKLLKRCGGVFFACGLATLSALAENAPPPLNPLPYLDPTQPVEARVTDLVGRLTLDEKASLMMNMTAGVPRLGVPKYDWWNEALHGVARAGEATVFPQAIGLAAMWDEALMHAVATTISIEARAKFNAAPAQGKAGERYYGLTFWTPNINIFRDPRWGRGQETYGEDPFLTARLGVAFVRGLQGDDPRYLRTAACAKHFAVHSGPESLRHDFDVVPPEEDFHDTYLPAFEALVREARVESVMMAYNSLYGRPCSVNPQLYGLLQRWGFSGHVVSDCGAILDLRKTYKTARDDAEAEAQSIAAGLCLRCGDEPTELATAVRRGSIPEAVVDQQLGQLLRTQFRLGFYDPAAQVPFSKIAVEENNTSAHGAVALEAARKSIVLLKNDGVLPLVAGKYKRILVVGPNADSVSVLLGNYNGTPTAPVTVLAGLKAALGAEATIDYAKGCDYAALPTGLRPIPRTGLRTGQYTGLMGDYFSNRELAGVPTATRRDRPVHFDWSQTELPQGMKADALSVRWKGNFLSAIEGEYRLAVKASGGIRLRMNGELLIDAWENVGEQTQMVVRSFAENATTPIELEYRQGNGPSKVSLQWETPDPAAGYTQAIAAAKQADLIVFVGGITAQLEGEEMQVDYAGFAGGDRTRIELPPVQEQLLENLHASGKPVVFILMSGSAVAVPWADEHVAAILQAWYPGQAAGTAVADVLAGNYNPAGRLPVTFYRTTEALPDFNDYGMAGRTYRYGAKDVLYPFGHGLSYTQFTYGRMKIEGGRIRDGATLKVSVDVTNSGGRSGEEVVQLYAEEPESTERRAVRSLCGFTRVKLAKGETRTVEISVPAATLRRWSKTQHAYAIPTGVWTLRAGGTSAATAATVVAELKVD